jgi:hypothetical protein
MKSKLLFVAVAAITIISYVSCKWFESSSGKNELVGKWQFVNVADSSKDSSKNGIGFLALAMVWKDTLQVEFTKDSVRVFTSKDSFDSGKYAFDDKQITIFGKNDTAVFNLNKLKDDSLQLSSVKDSIVYSLHKMK